MCAQNDITGYPTLKFFKQGENEGIRFRGTRDLPSLTTFINEHLRVVKALNQFNAALYIRIDF